MNRERVQAQLAIDEGVVYKIYLDHLGYHTFGIGHLIKESDPEFIEEVGTLVSKERVTEAFQADLDIAIDECKVLYEMWEDYPGEVQEILVNMMFNLGRPRLSKFKNMKKALDSRCWELAAVEGTDSRWYNQVGNRAERLMTRLENVANYKRNCWFR
ncbi:MAG: glycoside hydrolase family protein [Gammaproteobacteria bacterium]|nr:glycoside hydrolase family protein [Gammaproteobacteria bacterium]